MKSPEKRSIDTKEIQNTFTLLEKASETARVGGWEYDLSLKTLSWTRVTYEIHEIPFDTKLDTNLGILFYKEGYSRNRMQEVFSLLVTKGIPYDEELQIITKNGNEVWVRSIGIPEFENGVIVRIYGTLQDIDRQKKDRDKLNNTLNQLEFMHKAIEDSGDCFYMVNLDDHGKMIYVNEASVRHYKAPRETIYSWRVFDWDPNFTPENFPFLVEEIKNKKRLHLESKHKVADGSIVPVEITVNHYLSKEGENLAYGWFSDITERIEMQNQWNEAKLKAESANKAKSSFLANMSHEIRTPLNGVIGFTNILKETPLNEEQKKYLEIIDSSANSLLSIVSDILDFSKIESGMLHLDIIETDLHDFFSSALDVIRFQAQSKDIQLTLSIDDKLPKIGLIDPNRVKQILINLLGNSVKFTSSGSIDLNVKYQSLTESRGILTIAVKDTGIGILPEEFEKLFRPFTQADTTITRKFGGTGLGLSISNMLANLMNSKIEVESEYDKGSTFYFSIEIQVAEVRQEHIELLSKYKTGKERLKDLKSKILIVEDVKSNRILLKHLLQGFLPNSEILEAYDGKNAVELLETLSSNPKENYPDLIFMDVQMPILDGIEATYIIREKERKLNLNTPIVALTAAALKEEEEVCYAAGMDDFLTKPIERNKLQETLVEYLILSKSN
ncbi:MAG TPA: ATP-binding protein [Leptospiraceae bacterium]|nr:ATP-binding protein [Leptospiraceae bacterium]HMW06218.1 ATP-binding protein [Leptospiraceae bacterium]HMX34289.1 ATP-binding protein [Leptospiraceae bacterium]HMY31680.1 ATP-binding protein [Leptospiraceae bacterium]HMZ65653.1 ATP-binding protein [Leptospiraceae bacterium]